MYSIVNGDWYKFHGIKEIVKVTRTTQVKSNNNNNNNRISKEVSFYISSKKLLTKEYNYGIRAHCGVESMHYIKDVTFKEDASLIRTGNAPTNFSIIRNTVIDTLEREKYDSFPQAIRMMGGDIRRLFGILV